MQIPQQHSKLRNPDWGMFISSLFIISLLSSNLECRTSPFVSMNLFSAPFLSTLVSLSTSHRLFIAFVGALYFLSPNRVSSVEFFYSSGCLFASESVLPISILVILRVVLHISTCFLSLNLILSITLYMNL